MALAGRVEADLKSAMKSRNDSLTGTLRLVRSALKNREKELLRPLEEPEEIAVLKTMAKQRKEAMEQFAKGGRQDLVDKETAELEIIMGYLPEEMDQAAVEAVLDQVFAELKPQGAKEMGMVMKAAMGRLGGRADGKLVSQLVKSRLN